MGFVQQSSQPFTKPVPVGIIQDYNPARSILPNNDIAEVIRGIYPRFSRQGGIMARLPERSTYTVMGVPVGS